MKKVTYQNCLITIETRDRKNCIDVRESFRPVRIKADNKNEILTVIDEIGKSFLVTTLDTEIAEWDELVSQYENNLLICSGLTSEGNPTTATKELKEIITGYAVNDPKTPIKLFVFSNPNCVTTDIEGMNVVDLNNYNMANTPGYGRALPKNSSPLIPFSFCGPFTGTLADILIELANDTDFETAVTEEIPTGLTRLQIYQAPKGTTCKGAPVTAGGVVIGTRTLDDSEGWCKKKDYEDKDCDNYSEGIDLTTVLNIPAGAAILGEAIGICLDADDSDSAVQ